MRPKNLILFLAVFGVLSQALFFAELEKASAADTCSKATVHVVARNQAGNFIPGISYQILEQVVNVDGQIMPGRAVSSGKIDTILGEGKSLFSPTSGNYVVKMYDKNSNYGAFYFYNELTAACGEEKIFTGYLSGLQVELRDTSGALRKNTSFTISQQSYDANGQPIKQKGASIATFNSDVYGQNVIYLADQSHTIDQAPISYVLSSPGYGGSEFILYGITMDDKKTKELNYVFSDIKISFSDKNGKNLPAGTKVEFLTQKFDATGRIMTDKLIKSLSINNYGYALLEYPAGTYFFRIKKTNGDYYNFPGVYILDQSRTSSSFDAVDSSSEEVSCATNSILNVVARKVSGSYIPGIKFELYEKIINANGVPAAGALAAKGVINSLGNGSVSFKPNLGKTYILKMYDQNPKVGAFWYYDDIKFSCGETVNITKNLSSISLTARDMDGKLLKDYGFSLYLQKKDIDNNVLKTKDDLVADAKTNASGQATIYVTGGDPAQYQDIARYLISLKYNGMIFDQPDIAITAGADTQINYVLSGLKLTAIDAAGNNFPQGTIVYIYEQKIDANKNKILAKNVAKLKLDNYGQAMASLPPGVYALGIKDYSGQLMNIWDIKIENGRLNSQTATLPLLRVIAVDGAGKSLSKINLNVYSLTKNSDGWYGKNKNIYRTTITDLKYADIFLATGQYLVAMKLGASEFGKIVEINDLSIKKVYLSTKSEYLIKPGSVYKISVNNSGAVAGIKISSASSAAALAERLKGYILLQVESGGQAWYINPKDKKRYYMRSGAESFKTMRSLGVGVTDSDLSKIPVGVLPMDGEADCDSDGLPDSLERAIGTEVCKNDSDGDGYSDYVEVTHNYNSLGTGKLEIDQKLAVKLSGALLLQVDSNEEIWYVNPRDNKRYYIPDNNVGFKIMKYLSLGITNANLNLIEEAR